MVCGQRNISDLTGDMYSPVPSLYSQQAEVPEDSDDDDPDEVFGFITMLNLTERKVKTMKRLIGCWDLWQT